MNLMGTNIHSASDAVTDPVCGAIMEPQQAAQQYAYHDATYYFDRSECLEQFLADPEKFTQPQS